MSNALALHEAHNALDHMEQRFNALAVVAGREMPKYYKRAIAVPVTIGLSALASMSEAKFGTKGLVVNTGLAAAGYILGMLAGDNADLREIAYSVSIACGSSAASIHSYDKMTQRIAATTAPVPQQAAA